MQGIYRGTALFLIDSINVYRNDTAGKLITTVDARGGRVAGRAEREFRVAIDHTFVQEETDRAT